MTDSPEEPPEWVTGPPADYVPPSEDELRDPRVHEKVRDRGAAAVREVLASQGIVKVDGKWTRVEAD